MLAFWLAPCSCIQVILFANRFEWYYILSFIQTPSFFLSRERGFRVCSTSRFWWIKHHVSTAIAYPEARCIAWLVSYTLCASDTQAQGATEIPCARLSFVPFHSYLSCGRREKLFGAAAWGAFFACGDPWSEKLGRLEAFGVKLYPHISSYILIYHGRVHAQERGTL